MTPEDTEVQRVGPKTTHAFQVAEAEDLLRNGWEPSKSSTQRASDLKVWCEEQSPSHLRRRWVAQSAVIDAARRLGWRVGPVDKHGQASVYVKRRAVPAAKP